MILVKRISNSNFPIDFCPKLRTANKKKKQLDFFIFKLISDETITKRATDPLRHLKKKKSFFGP